MNKCLTSFAILAAFCFASSGGAQLAELGVPTPAPLKQRLVRLKLETGDLASPARNGRVVFDDTVRIEGASWVRLKFDQVVLAGDAALGTGSFLRITSLADGGVQILDAQTVAQWESTSAYFNGDAVRIELFAHPGVGFNSVSVPFAWAGRAPGIDPPRAGLGEGEVGEDTICGTTDDRVLSSDPRSARVVPVGCTVFMIDDAAHCFLTAGHCSGSSLQIVQFNVPLSSSGGALRHPPPEDQYSVDVSSKQAVSGGIGNDWGYFGVFPNANTGLTPFEAQGDFYTTASSPPSVSGQNIRITGYGVDNGTRNQVQQTHAGPYRTFSGTTVQYRTDTTGGNSGSGVQDDSTGMIIGIHTHGGCTSGGGANSGTGVNNAGLRNALANPRGVCAVGLDFAYPDGRPDSVNPSGGSSMRVQVSGQNGGQPAAGSGMLHYDIGGGFISVPMADLGGNQYEAVFPAAPCGTEVRYYVSAETTTGLLVTDPSNAPAMVFSTLSATAVTVAFADDFETNLGWTVQNTNLAAGAWERAVPSAGGTRGDPETDFDGSGRCYVTGNSVNEDVDGGPTRLLSPVIDLSSLPGAVVSYARWFTNTTGEDRMVIEISNNNGASWTQIESVSNTAGWVLKSFTVSDFVTPTAQVRLRFSVADNPNNSRTEGGVDAVSFGVVHCSEPAILTDVTRTLGIYLSGGLPELQASDDTYYVLQSGPGNDPSEPHPARADFGFDTQGFAAATVDVTLEERSNIGGPTSVVLLRNWGTSQWDEIGRESLSPSDQAFSFAGIPAASYINGAGRLEVRARSFAILILDPNSRGIFSHDFVGVGMQE